MHLLFSQHTSFRDKQCETKALSTVKIKVQRIFKKGAPLDKNTPTEVTRRGNEMFSPRPLSLR